MWSLIIKIDYSNKFEYKCEDLEEVTKVIALNKKANTHKCEYALTEWDEEEN